jgi:hypothetical protein
MTPGLKTPPVVRVAGCVLRANDYWDNRADFISLLVVLIWTAVPSC